MQQASRPCKGCGRLIYRTAPVAPIRHYCSPSCRPQCSVDDCGRPSHSKGMCSVHAARAYRTGDPLTPLERTTNSGACSVKGCDEPMRKRTWCASHYAQWQRSGKTPERFQYKWGARATPCANCGGHDYQPGQRTFCSKSCRAAFKLYGGARPTSKSCIACGVVIDLTIRGKRGQLKKTRTMFCRPCKQDYRKYKMSARELSVRDGTTCGICGESVDMDLSRRDGLMCPSVDHVIPRSHGGSHNPSNLQLAHLLCNMLKSDRV